jgi:hypothetical protein
MPKLLSSPEVRRLIAEEIERLYKRRASHWEQVELPATKGPEPVSPRMLYKRVTAGKRLAAPPRHGTMTAYERVRMLADTFAIMRRLGLK